MNILIATGGTGGHLYPALAVGKELKKRNIRILFAVKSSSLTLSALSAGQFEYREIPSSPIIGKTLYQMIQGFFQNVQGVFHGLNVVREFQPDCAIGFGSYAAVPVLTAAFLKKVPILLHEQNVTPGWANRFCSTFSKKVAVSFPKTRDYFPGKSFLAGNPVREDILTSDPSKSRTTLGLKENRTTILVFGGSAGAKIINRTIIQCLSGLIDYREKIQFLHLTGNHEETERVKAEYADKKFHASVRDYSDRMGPCYLSADFAVCRSGATTLAELIATRTPAVLIPYPYATGNHQKTNASYLAAQGCASVIVESENLKSDLLTHLREWISSEARLVQMRENYKPFPNLSREAPAKLADALIEMAA